MVNQEELQKRLHAVFQEEAEEHLAILSSGLGELEQTETPEERKQIVETIYRSVHSLKGASRAVGLLEIESLCQPLEDVLAALKKKPQAVPPEFFLTADQTIDLMRRLLSSPQADYSTEVTGLIQKLLLLKNTGESGKDRKTLVDIPSAGIEEPPGCPAVKDEPSHVDQAMSADRSLKANKELIQCKKAENAASEKTGEVRTNAGKVQESISSSIRISTAKLDALMLQSEEMLAAKLMANQRVFDLAGIKAAFLRWKKEWGKINSDLVLITKKQKKQIQGDLTGKNDVSHRKVLDFIEWTNTHLKIIDTQVKTFQKNLEADTRSLGRLADNLLQGVKETLMLPFSSYLEVLSKMVRDLSRGQGKQIHFLTEGMEIEIDKRILEEIRDPIIHILRNSIDHGIELPEERSSYQKPPRGTLHLSVSQKDSGKVEILIADDGKGIHPAKVKEIAIRKGFLTRGEAEKIDEKALFALLFQSGFSTSSLITDISGRGLGLAIVQEKVEKLGGSITVETKLHAGTTFRMLLPIRLATFRGTLIQVRGRNFILPTGNVERVLRIKKEEIKTIENKDILVFDGQPISLAPLGAILELPENKKSMENRGYITIAIVRSMEKVIAFSVDKIIREQEILVKGLGKQLSRVRNVAGATVMSSGEIIPILTVSDLIKSAANVALSVDNNSLIIELEAKETKKILVAEDSITSRMLIKHILESAGYKVKTTVDGAEALTVLKTEPFHLVVSDVQMPGMDGFELTAKIRSDKELSALPVVLVTSLDQREHRERGIEVGADAYIVKSNFDQSRLLETIQRLL